MDRGSLHTQEVREAHKKEPMICKGAAFCDFVIFFLVTKKSATRKEALKKYQDMTTMRTPKDKVCKSTGLCTLHGPYNPTL
jgi:hypothetical protein